MIYNNSPSTQNALANFFDSYFLWNPGADSVRRRLSRSVSLALEHFDRCRTHTTNVASLACGSGYELFLINEQMCKNGIHDNVSYTGIDLDVNAIRHARQLAQKSNTQFNFVHENAFQLQNVLQRNSCNIIISLGLFDYFDDRLLRIMLQKVKRVLSSDGVAVIGNFTPDWDWHDRWIMDNIIDWKLKYRTEFELLESARASGLQCLTTEQCGAVVIGVFVN